MLQGVATFILLGGVSMVCVCVCGVCGVSRDAASGATSVYCGCVKPCVWGFKGCVQWGNKGGIRGCQTLCVCGFKGCVKWGNKVCFLGCQTVLVGLKSMLPVRQQGGGFGGAKPCVWGFKGCFQWGK